MLYGIRRPEAQGYQTTLLSVHLDSITMSQFTDTGAGASRKVQLIGQGFMDMIGMDACLSLSVCSPFSATTCAQREVSLTSPVKENGVLVRRFGLAGPHEFLSLQKTRFETSAYRVLLCFNQLAEPLDSGRVTIPEFTTRDTVV